MSDMVLDQIVEMAFKLSVAEQAKLLERVAAHLATSVEEAEPVAEERLDWTVEELKELLSPSQPKTGAEIAALITAGGLDTSEWAMMINPHITDAVEWVKALRRDSKRHRNLDWGNDGD